MSSGTGTPCDSATSAIKAPEPPEIEYRHAFGPVPAGSFANSAAVSRSSSRSRTLTTPYCWNSPFTTASEPARCPVCEEAIRVPASVDPTFKATTGLRAELAASSALLNLGGSLNPSK